MVPTVPCKHDSINLPGTPSPPSTPKLKSAQSSLGFIGCPWNWLVVWCAQGAGYPLYCSVMALYTLPWAPDLLMAAYTFWWREDKINETSNAKPDKYVFFLSSPPSARLALATAMQQLARVVAVPVGRLFDNVQFIHLSVKSALSISRFQLVWSWGKTRIIHQPNHPWMKLASWLARR